MTKVPSQLCPKTVIEMWIICLDPVSANSEKGMGLERSEEKFLKGIVGDKTMLRFWNKHQKIELVFTQLARYI